MSGRGRGCPKQDSKGSSVRGPTDLAFADSSPSPLSTWALHPFPTAGPVGHSLEAECFVAQSLANGHMLLRLNGSPPSL